MKSDHLGREAMMSRLPPNTVETALVLVRDAQEIDRAADNLNEADLAEYGARCDQWRARAAPIRQALRWLLMTELPEDQILALDRLFDRRAREVEEWLDLNFGPYVTPDNMPIRPGDEAIQKWRDWAANGFKDFGGHFDTASPQADAAGDA